MSSINDLSVQQLLKAADLKEEIQALQQQLAKLTGTAAKPAATVAAKAPKKKGGMSAAGRASLVAAQKARWAKIKAAKPAAKKAVATKVSKPAKKKSGMSAAAKAKLSAAMKARWAAKKAAKK